MTSHTRKVEHRIAVGDTYTPLGRTLYQGNEAMDLTGLTVQFKLIQADGTTLTDWTATGVTVVSATAGDVQYDFLATDVDTAGVFYGYFRAGAGSEWATFPPGDKLNKIVITDTN